MSKHLEMWHNVSAAAWDVLLDTADRDTAVADVIAQQLAAFAQAFAEWSPSTNSFYFKEWIPTNSNNNVAVVAVCKPRGYRKASDEVGWAIAIVTEDEAADLILAQNQAELLLHLIDATPEQARQWTAVY